MLLTNWRGKEETRELSYTLDIRDHRGEPGWALLAIAANTHLSVGDLLSLLELGGVGRSRSWVARRRWLFQQPGAVNATSPPNRDGKDAWARKIMSEHPSLSVRDLSVLLEEKGIVRSREWVRRHRCDLLTDTPPSI
jgi:hypothetical protein